MFFPHLLWFAFVSWSVHLIGCEETHFVVKGLPNEYELKQFISDNGLLYRSHGSLGSDLHYFVSDRDISHKYDSFLDLPWVESVHHQSQFLIEKKAPVVKQEDEQFYLVKLENDDEYALEVRKRAQILRDALNFNDPNSGDLWQLLNSGESMPERTPGIDINVYPVYMANITGKGVVGMVVDDALDTTHEDLRPNIRLNLTADLVNSTRRDARGTDDIMQHNYDHGTEVAGLFAAVANNSKCAFGVAYNATLGGIRLLGRKVTDYMVGEAFTMFAPEVNIYISSWGPLDDGKTMHIPGQFMNIALQQAWEYGNHGHGSVFVFPTGNGGGAGDNCGADGFVNHPRIIGVSAMSESGLPPVYGEYCAAVAISIPIGGAPDIISFKKQLKSHRLFIATTQINNQCTLGFVGTSASNPMAAGVIALAMEANPKLTPRDVSAILALSGRIPAAGARGFSLNGGGLLVSHTYGSGLLNAVRMVKLARSWKSIGPQRFCVQYLGTWASVGDRNTYESDLHRNIYVGRDTNFTFSFDDSNCHVEIIEVARVGMQWISKRRGAIEVFLTSPSGQVAELLRARPMDRFQGRSEMLWKSLLHTGETCYGKWTVTIRDTGMRGFMRHAPMFSNAGYIRFLALELRGTSYNDSAYALNREEIIKHWHPLQFTAHDYNWAIKLNGTLLETFYDIQRWEVLKETMDY